MLIQRLLLCRRWGSIACSTVLVFCFALLYPQDVGATQVTVPSGTIVEVVTGQALTPQEVHVGDIIVLTVGSDVVVQDQVVIKAGAKAIGEIVRAKNHGLIGIPSELGLAMRSVEAADGKTIQLYGTKTAEGKDKMILSIGLAVFCCLLFGLMKGGDTMIPPGTRILTTVAANTDVSVP